MAFGGATEVVFGDVMEVAVWDVAVGDAMEGEVGDAA